MKPSLPVLEPILLEGYELNVDYYLKKPYDDVAEASEELPALIEWVNSKLQWMIEQKNTKKQEIYEVEAAAFFDLKRGVFTERGYAGKLTDAALSHAVALEQPVKDAHREYAVLLGWVHRLTTLLGSLQSKLELVRSTEATRRQVSEFGSDDTRERRE